MKRYEHGFTLAELMVVVVMVGILTAIAIPNFIAMRDKAREGATKTAMHIVQLAAEDYGVTHDGAYAHNLNQLRTAMVNHGSKLLNAFTKELTEPSNGTGPGAITYEFIADTARGGMPDSTLPGHYKIHGRGTGGRELALELSSEY